MIRSSGLLSTILLLAICAAALHAGRAAGDVIVLRSGLVLRAPSGLPDIIGTKDPVEYAFVAGKWKAPAAGGEVRFADTLVSRWERITAEPDGWFRASSLRPGYLYLTYDSPSDRVLLLRGMAHSFVSVNGEPRAGNPYQTAETFAAWEPDQGYYLLPVLLHKGRNEFLFYASQGLLKAQLETPANALLLNVRDMTLPDLVAGREFDTHGSVLIVNCTETRIRNASLSISCAPWLDIRTPLPPIPPLAVRKLPFRLRGAAPATPGKARCFLRLADPGMPVADTASVDLTVARERDARKETFTSDIDGSVQYYAVYPPAEGGGGAKALFLSLHGAGVEALNQARAYAPKDWGYIVAPTNRRPYGYNWEDWGRMDALEALAIAKRRFPIDGERVYLTGHSMGGHGVYHIGALYPDQFAAIAPSAGWISFWTYRVRAQRQNPSPLRKMLMRAALQSETFALAPNYRGLGVYILHGEIDDNVPVLQSRMMADTLAKFHKDFIYHEQPGQGHWWDLSPAPGADCVDWPPMFDFFARHARPEAERVRSIEFLTPNPGVSSSDYWLSIEGQKEQCRLSGASVRFEPGGHLLEGTTNNVSRISFDCAILNLRDSVRVRLDGQWIGTRRLPDSDGRVRCERRDTSWSFASPPSPSVKGPQRCGTFKDLFRNRAALVYGTKGSPEENRWAYAKARYDAERFWYQGNGSFEVVADVDFNPAGDNDRNVVLYGNAATNALWKKFLGGSPVSVAPGEIRAGAHRFQGGDLCCLMIRPRPFSDVASVGCVGGTGLAGMRLTNRLAYLSPGIGFPDLLIARADMLLRGEEAIPAAGFFGPDWSLEQGEIVWTE